MPIESDRRNRETVPAPSGQSDDGGEKPSELKDMTGPAIDRQNEQSRLADNSGDDSNESRKELKDITGPSIDRASEQQRNRDLWTK